MKYWFLGLTPNTFLAICSALQWVSFCCLSSHATKFVCPFLYPSDETACLLQPWRGMPWKLHDLRSIIMSADGTTLYTRNNDTIWVSMCDCAIQQYGTIRECNWMMNWLWEKYCRSAIQSKVKHADEWLSIFCFKNATVMLLYKLFGFF